MLDETRTLVQLYKSKGPSSQLTDNDSFMHKCVSLKLFLNYLNHILEAILKLHVIFCQKEKTYFPAVLIVQQNYKAFLFTPDSNQKPTWVSVQTYVDSLSSLCLLYGYTASE